MCYYTTGLDLGYITKKDGQWTSGTVESEGYVGMFPSIALDDNGEAHMSYYDYSDETLRCARISGVEDIRTDESFLASYWWLLMTLIIIGVVAAIAGIMWKKR